MKFTITLNEKVLSVGLNDSHEKYRKMYKDQIIEIISKSYESIGGYESKPSGSSSERKAISDNIDKCLIKIVVRDGKVTAVNLYKDDAYGRKSVAAATNGTEQGKKDFKMIKSEDIKQERAYGEVSGAVEHILRKLGAPVVSSDKVSNIIGKEIEVVDGEYYKRSIGGHNHTKIMMGFPKKKG